MSKGLLSLRSVQLEALQRAPANLRVRLNKHPPSKDQLNVHARQLAYEAAGGGLTQRGGARSSIGRYARR